MKEYVLQPSAPKNLKIDYERELNAEQFAVVRDGDGMALVLAGAGSGKTRTIVYRVAWLLEHGVAPSEILLLTFTNRAAREMVERVEALLGFYPEGLWAGTYHSIANRLLRRYADAIGFQSNFSILDQEDARDLIAMCVKECGVDTTGKRFPKSTVLQSIISYSRNSRAGISDTLEKMHPKFLPIRSEIERVADRYRDQKRLQNAMDFDDLLVLLLELLTTNPGIAEALSTGFRYILVDEFQDTNSIQADIVKILARVHENLLVVGDDAQSIYSFRAADIANILDFPKQYEHVAVYRLTMNYRSTPQILSIANSVIANNTKQFEKELQSMAGGGAKPEMIPTSSSRQEAEFIAQKILDLRNGGVELNEIAVLFRATYHSQSLEFELLKRDIPYDYRGGLRFFERSHIKDAVAHVRIAENMKDLTAWSRILRIHPGLGLAGSVKIAEEASRYDSLPEFFALYAPKGKRAQAGFAGAKRICEKMLLAGGTPSERIRAIASSDDYRAYLEMTFPNFEERIEDIEQFALFAEQFTDAETFLATISLTDEWGAGSQKPAFEEARVVLSTIHQAKGLEWRAVFVMHLAEGMFPHSRAYEDEAQMEEERRLFYVAVTRARENLYLSYPVTAGMDRVEICQPSTFLEEIPSRQIEEVRLKSAPSYQSPYKSFHKPTTDSWEEPVIVLNELGDKMEERPMPKSFLRGGDDF